MSSDLRARLAAAQSKSGLEGPALWRSAWRAFRQARDGVGLAVGPDELEDVNEELSARFVRAVQFAAAEIEGSGETAKSWSATAREMAVLLYGEGVEVNAAQLATLEAVVRHAANAMDYAGEEDGLLADLEYEWRSWAPRKCGMDQAPTQLAEPGDADPDSGD